MKIGIDLDNVTYPFVDQLQPIAEHILKRQLTVPYKWDFYTEWLIDEEDFDQLLLDAHDTYGLWHVGTPVKGALEVLGWLQGDGHEVHVVTQRPAYAFSTTSDWLAHWSVPYDLLTFAWSVEGKAAGGYDIMLDDAPHVLTSCPGAVAFHQPWNRHVPGKRVASWQDFYQLVRKVNRERVL